MENIVVDKSALQSPEALTKFIEQFGPQVGVHKYVSFKLPTGFYYEDLSIDFTRDGGPSQSEVGYGWSLTPDFKVSGTLGYPFPVRWGFKTFKGMIKNLVKYLDFAITSYAESLKPVVKEKITEVMALVVRDKRDNSIIQLTPITDGYSHIDVEYPAGYVTPQELREHVEGWMGKDNPRALEAEQKLLNNQSWFDQQEAKDFNNVGNLVIKIETLSWN